MGEPIPLSLFQLDYPTPPIGWNAELAHRGVAIVLDDIGRPSIPRAAARDLLMERREQQEAAARKRAEIDRRAVEADQRFRASLPAGIPAGMVPEGISAAALMMYSDPLSGARRRSVVEDALAHAGTVFTPIQDERADQ